MAVELMNYSYQWFPEPPTEPLPPSPCEEAEELYVYQHGPTLMFPCSECGRWHDTYWAHLMDEHYADILPQEPYIYGWVPF